MGAVIALLAAAAALAFAALPLMRREGLSERQAAEASDLLSQRDVALNDIRDLDFDRDLGNLSEDDHLELREQSKRRAVAILKQLRAEEQRIDDEIEQAVASVRDRDSAAP